MADPLGFLADELAALERADLLRRRAIRQGLVVCSNDYLGFAAERVETAGLAGGAGASALVSGYGAAHQNAEQTIREWVGTEAALLFSSGYAVNVGTIAALVGPGDLVLSDRLNHASIVDGCRLSRATVLVVDHADLGAFRSCLEQRRRGFRRCLVATESYFSMDADGPDLRALSELAAEHDAVLYVDDAHALGVEGTQGRGRCAEAGITPDVLIGTLGKAVGLQGAFVAGSERLVSYLWNRARSFVFSTGMAPVMAELVGARVREVRAADDRRARLRQVSSALRGALAASGSAAAGSGHIVPWILGSAPVALKAERDLQALGICAPAIRPPTVPEGSARIRLTGSAALSDAELDRVVAALTRVSARC